MKFLKVLLIFLPICCCCLQRVSALSDQLLAFHKAILEATAELQNVKSSVGINGDEQLLRQRRHTIDELLANFHRNLNMADELEGNVERVRRPVFRQRRAKQCKGDSCDGSGGGGDGHGGHGNNGGGAAGDWKYPSVKTKKGINLEDEIAKLHSKYKTLSEMSNMKENKVSNEDLVTYFSTDNDHIVANIANLNPKVHDARNDAGANHKLFANVNMRLSGKVDTNPQSKGGSGKLQSSSSTHRKANSNANKNYDTSARGGVGTGSNLKSGLKNYLKNYNNKAGSPSIQMTNTIPGRNYIGDIYVTTSNDDADGDANTNSNSKSSPFTSRDENMSPLDNTIASGSSSYGDSPRAHGKLKSNINGVLLLETDTYSNANPSPEKNKYKFDWIDNKPAGKDDDRDADLSYNDDVSYEKTIENIHFPSIVNDQFDFFKNDLSHEADYKLSKIEQDAAEKRRMPGSSSGWGWMVNKRSAGFNPMDEIKLRTSSRLMRKGFGPSLPSYSLMDTRRELMIDDAVRKLEDHYGTKQKSHNNFDVLDTMLSLADDKVTKNRKVNDPGDIISQIEGIRVELPKEALLSPMKLLRDDDRDKTDKALSTNLDMELSNVRVEREDVLGEDEAVADGADSALSEEVDVDDEAEAESGFLRKEKRCGESKKTGDSDTIDPNSIYKGKTKRVCQFPAVVQAGRKRVKRIGILNEFGQMLEVKEMDVPLVERSDPERRKRETQVMVTAKASEKVLSRRKRTLPLLEEEVFEGDDVETSECRIRAKRNVKQEAEAKIKRATYKRSARQLVHEEDDNNSVNPKALQRVGAAGVDDYDDFSARRKRTFHGTKYDFGGSANEFGNVKFDNIKQKEETANTFDGMKFDNLWYGNINTNLPLKSSNNKNGTKRKLRNKSNNDKRYDAGRYDYRDIDDDDILNDSNKDSDGEDNSKAQTLSAQDMSNELSKASDKKMILALRDQILNCTAFNNLESFLKSISAQNKSLNGVLRGEQTGGGTSNSGAATGCGSHKDEKETEKEKEKIEMNVTANSLDTTTSPTDDVEGTTVASAGKFATGISTTASSSSQVTASTPRHKADMMKLNITINASVMGDKKAKNFFGNGTFKVQSEERERRGISFSEFDRYKKYKGSSAKSSNSGCEGGAGLNIVDGGKLADEAVKNILGMVRCSPKLKMLWPSLKRNMPAPNENANSQEPNLSAIQSLEAEGGEDKIERMVQKAMVAINSIIEEEVEGRSCIPLRPDLRDFYELILQTYEEQSGGRDKRASAASTASEFSKEMRAIDANKIEEKSRIVKKLLRQYDDLPSDDQEQVSEIREDLVNNLLYLQRLRENEERYRRGLVPQTNAEGDAELLKSMEGDYTPQYLRLAKTSELLREAASEREQ